MQNIYHVLKSNQYSLKNSKKCLKFPEYSLNMMYVVFKNLIITVLKQHGYSLYKPYFIDDQTILKFNIRQTIH